MCDGRQAGMTGMTGVAGAIGTIGTIGAMSVTDLKRHATDPPVRRRQWGGWADWPCEAAWMAMA